MHSGQEAIIIGDLNAGSSVYERVNKGRGTTLVNFARRRNYKVTPHKEPSFFEKGKRGWSKPDLVLHREELKWNNQRTRDGTIPPTILPYSTYSTKLRWRKKTTEG